ncbi:hypothetical protein FA95DRAFT_511959 [Auriscalpium vulgare]|uniref:Uncharacterized protein n=1 Tax=Auriscalpium vulgare TaxID=40419 RepID=A0ACB8RF66_9AGAM|nr:hypothetical protein FA95DRAFT_511959 [Auriscalpium vulgare]
MADQLRQLSLDLKRSVNQAHNHLHESLSPLAPVKSTPPRIRSCSFEFLNPLFLLGLLITILTGDMSHTYGGVDSQNPNAPAQAPYGVPPIPKIPDDLKFPNPMEIFSDIPGRFRTFKGELQEFFSRLKYVFILPLSWFLTFASFGKNLLKRLIFLPVTISLNIYEGKIRTWWPWLPSIWGLFFALFPQGIKLPSLTTWVTGKYNGAGPTDIPTMEVDMSQFMNAGTNAAGDVANGTADGLKQAAGDLKQAGGMATAASQADTNTLNGPQSQMNQLDGVLKDVKGLPEADVIQETKVRDTYIAPICC